MAHVFPHSDRSWALSLCLTASYALILPVILLGCALGVDHKSPPLVKDCVLPPDQSGTLTGHWKALPATAVPIAFHQGDWQPDEIADMVAAADTWNAFYGATLNMKALDYGTDPNNPRMSSATSPSALCATGITQGNGFIGNVVIYKRGKWPYPSQVGSTIALTSFCPSPARPLNFFYMAIMEVNYQGFFVQGQKVPDLRTIVLHELGHLLGLGHSCEGSPKSGQPNCNQQSLSPDYLAAVMYPSFSFDEALQGQQKRDLTTNDQGRANCLYFSGAETGNTGH